MFKIKDPNKRHLFLKACLVFLIGALLSLALIMPLRGVMNAVNRVDFISQRLDDYPRMYASYLQENEEWWNWWITEDYGKRAEQAVFIYTSDESHGSEAEKLTYIAETLGAETAQIIPASELESLKKKDEEADLSTCHAELPDGRLLALSIHDSLRESRMSYVEDEDFFLSQLQAGLPGYVAIVHDGELSLYPKDDKEAALRSMIEGMLAGGQLNPAALREQAKADETGTARNVVRNPKTGEFPKGKYMLSSAAYAENPDFVINIAEESTLIRIGRKRSWSLWFLWCAIMVLLVKCLWNTKLYRPDTAPGEEGRVASRRGAAAMLMTVLLVFGSVTVIQMLSGVNLSQQGATDQALYLKNILGRESERADRISGEFDNMYSARVRTAATVLSGNPQLIDDDSLLDLDRALGGSGLRVFKSDGTLLASDEIMHHAVDESLVTSAVYQIAKAEVPEEEQPSRYYRAALTDAAGKNSGWVELCVEKRQLEDLLKNTTLKEVVEDLHLLDTLHVVVVESGEGAKIVAGTRKNWVGESAEEHGIQSQFLYDGYEGIVNFEGSKCYSVVFSYGNNYVIVGSEDVSALVFIGGVMILSMLLILLLYLVIYRPMTKQIALYQKSTYATYLAGGDQDERNEYPHLGNYLKDFMIAVFLLSAALYFSTKGNPAGLTYNIVRGTWIRGINAATITTCVMLVSVVFAAQRAVDVFLSHMGKYLSPKSMTICRLLDSGLTYISTIVMVIYALSMFGVNTRTLLNGVGVTALIFTLGANSLIADVVAGIFIIFEGDFTVGDMVVIGDFRGIVKDISMRTTKLMDDNTRDILVVSNSKIEQLINQSRERSALIIDLPISRSLGLEKGEAILKEAIAKLPQKFPQILSTPEYWGVSELPKKNMYSGKLGGPKARIAFDCLEHDKEMLTYQVYRELVPLVTDLSLGAAHKDAAAHPAEPEKEEDAAHAPELAKAEPVKAEDAGKAEESAKG